MPRPRTEKKGPSRPPVPFTWKLLLGALVASLWLLVGAVLFRVYLRIDPTGGQRVYARLTGQMTHFIPDPAIGWVPTPLLNQDGDDPDGIGRHRFQTDANGFRSPAPLERFEGQRLVLLGDSMVWGMGVDQERIAGSVLRQRLGAGHEVIVAATPGWSTDQEYLFTQERVIPFHPDVVFWFITAVNDIVMNLHGQSNTGVVYKKPRFSLDSRGALTLVPIDPGAPAASPGEVVEKNASMLNIFYKHPNAEFLHAIQLTGAILEKGKEAWKVQGVRVYYILFKPNLITEVSSSYQEFARNFGYNPDDFSETKAMEHMEVVAREAGIDLYYFDTQPHQMFKTDGHLNDAGHAALAGFMEQIMNGRATPLWRYDVTASHSGVR